MADVIGAFLFSALCCQGPQMATVLLALLKGCWQCRMSVKWRGDVGMICREFEANGVPPRPAMKEKVEAAAAELAAAAGPRRAATRKVHALAERLVID